MGSEPYAGRIDSGLSHLARFGSAGSSIIVSNSPDNFDLICPFSSPTHRPHMHLHPLLRLDPQPRFKPHRPLTRQHQGRRRLLRRHAHAEHHGRAGVHAITEEHGLGLALGMGDEIAGQVDRTSMHQPCALHVQPAVRHGHP